MTPVRVVIPARMASARLPNKPLLTIAGKPMLQHVFERIQKANVTSVLIATDSEEVRKAAKAFGAEVCMTSAAHESGTARIAEAVEKQGYADTDIILNLQCDEPLLEVGLIDQLASTLQQSDRAMIATLGEPLDTIEAIFDPNIVKVVCDQSNYAMYFSRAPIPWVRDAFPDKAALPSAAPFLKHIGLYAYRVAGLRKYVNLTPSPLELLERLEQLRVLWHGEKVYVALAQQSVGPSVDTAEDLAKVQKLLGD